MTWPQKEKNLWIPEFNLFNPWNHHQGLLSKPCLIVFNISKSVERRTAPILNITMLIHQYCLFPWGFEERYQMTPLSWNLKTTQVLLKKLTKTFFLILFETEK